MDRDIEDTVYGVLIAVWLHGSHHGALILLLLGAPVKYGKYEAYDAQWVCDGSLDAPGVV